MRFIVSVFATVAIFLAATAATASVDLSVSGVIVTGANAGSTDLTLAGAGDQVRLDISASNTGNAVVGLTTSVSSGDLLANLNFDGGKTADSWFNSTTGKFGDPQGGLANLKGTSNGGDGTYTSYQLPRTLSGADIIGGAVQFFSSVALVSSNGDGSLDYGILTGATGVGGSPDVGFTGAGALHAQLFFTLTANGATLVQFGMGPNDGLVVESGDGILNGTSIVIGAVPEPGTALLMGLGLSGLSLAGRRRS